MISLRPRHETLRVALLTSIPAFLLAGQSESVLPASLFGVLFVLRFALQPADGEQLLAHRRLLLALLGCAAIGCFVWAAVARIARWPA